MVDEVVRHLNKDIVLTSFGAELIEAVVLKEIFKLKVVYLYYPLLRLSPKAYAFILFFQPCDNRFNYITLKIGRLFELRADIFF